MILELDVTHMVIDDVDTMPLLSGSRAELGDNAGPMTWQNSFNYASERPLLKTPEEVEHARDYFKDFGAWDDEERAAWSAEEVNALVIQYIAGNIREMEAYETYEEYEEAERQGKVSYGLYKQDDHWFFSLNH